MTLIVLAYLGGVLTIVSPCILPVLPFVFAAADRPFVRNGLPMLAGMTISFAAVATLAAVAGDWAVRANEVSRIAAIVLMAIFGLALLFPVIADALARPFVALGNRLTASAGARTPGLASSALLGVATGLLWAPCAGPVLGLILTGAALRGASIETSLLLLAYAAGAATSLALALLAGGRIFAAMKKSLGAGEWIRRGLGIAVLAAVVAIFLGADTGFLTQVSQPGTASLEQKLIDTFNPKPSETKPAATAGSSAMVTLADGRAVNLTPEGAMPSLAGATEWLNAPPLSAEALKGKVVLVDFWTYSCINCLRSIPYVRAWAQKYKDAGLVVIGVHAPEFAFERNVANVRRAVADLKITYPVAIDNDYAIWRGFDNAYWPAHYFIDAQGRIRFHHFGEGRYDESEQVVQALLAEAGRKGIADGLVQVNGTGAEAAASEADVKSPETYLGYGRAENFASPGGIVSDRSHDYAAAAAQLNDWSLTGSWTVRQENAMLDRAGGGITYRFHARDLHLVLGPAADGKPVRFRITVDGKAPGADHGTDADADGNGTVSEQRLYQLVRQHGPVADRTFSIEFLDPGVQAYAFTFG